LGDDSGAKLGPLVLRLGNLAGLLLAVAWLARTPDWEPAIAVVALLCTQVAQELRASRNPARLRDRALYSLFVRDLPYDGPIRFVKETNLAGSFDRKERGQMSAFVGAWTDARHRFLDGALEDERKHLHRVCGEYLEHIATATFNVGDGRQAIPPEWEEGQQVRGQNEVLYSVP
jgi:hypothetical protein